mmetsp:Transcript_41815/g.90628  ORF Transcript_41815/g.90628 Transcript_41815/m.90628 type:complete len:218 (-) Transcript_41815:217-870(-)
MSRNGEDQRLSTKIMRQGLHHLQQGIGPFAGDDGCTIELCIVHCHGHVLRQIAQQNLVRRSKTLTSSVFVDGLDHTQAVAPDVNDGESQQMPSHIPCLFVEGLVESGIFVAVCDIHSLLRVEDLASNALPRPHTNRMFQVRGVQDQHLDPLVVDKEGNAVAVQDLETFLDDHSNSLLWNNLRCNPLGRLKKLPQSIARHLSGGLDQMGLVSREHFQP